MFNFLFKKNIQKVDFFVEILNQFKSLKIKSCKCYISIERAKVLRSNDT